METKEKKVEVVLQPISVGKLNIKIRGKTPLLMDRLPDEVKKGILAKQAGIAKGNKKKIRDTKQETQEAIHLLERLVIQLLDLRKV